MQNLQIRGEKLSLCLPVKTLHQKGVVFRCLIWGTEGTPGAVLSLERSPRWCLLLAIHCHFPNVTENLSLMNYHLFYQGHLEILTCITIPLLIKQCILLQKILIFPINISGVNNYSLRICECI